MRKRPVDEAPNVQPEGIAPDVPMPEAEAKPKKKYVNKKKDETPLQKVTRRLARAKRAYEKLPDGDGPESPETIAKRKALAHLNGCAERFAKVADPSTSTEVAEPQAA